MSFVNHQNASIKFTIEETNDDKKLPFLDFLKIIGVNGALTFEIYRKPTTTNRCNTSNSNHCGQHNKSACHSKICRLLHIPMSKEAFSGELETICGLAEMVGFTRKWMEKVLQHHKYQSQFKNFTKNYKENEITPK